VYSFLGYFPRIIGIQTQIGQSLCKEFVKEGQVTSLVGIMESKLAQFAVLSQKDKGPAFISLLPEIITRSNQSAVAADLHILVNTVVNHDNVGLVVGRQVLSELVKVLGEGAIKDAELRKRVVEDTLTTVQPRIVSYEEQVSLASTPPDNVIELLF
jgi:hypothetical protein